MMRYLLVGILLTSITLTLLADTSSRRSQITFAVEDIQSPVFSAKGIQMKLSGENLSQLSFHINEVIAQERTWRDLSLTCDQFQLTDSLVDCTGGMLQITNSESLSVVFRYSSDDNAFDIEIKPTADEQWQFAMYWVGDAWQNKLTIVNGQMARIAQWLTKMKEMPVPNKGTLNGVANLSGNADGVTDVEIALIVDALAFSDSSGLHAGEDVSAAINMTATHSLIDNHWQWQSDINWQNGGVFWQPLYLTGRGHRLELEGVVSEEKIQLHQGKLKFVDVGTVEFSGAAMRQNYELIDFNLDTGSLELSVLFDQIINPFLGNTAFADMQVTGKSDVAWRYRQSVSESFDMGLYDVSVIDQRKRFAFNRVNAHVPWHKEKATIADISFLSAHVLQIPLGDTRVALEINDNDLRIPQLVLPVLDGALELENFKAIQQDDGWYWQFSAELLPISMEELTEALQIQTMHGTLSGKIPGVSYKKSAIAVNGELSFNIFDGIVTAKKLQLIDPLGFAPHLKVDLAMRDLDLDLLTRTFSFGNMQGRIDMEMKRVELSNWRPIKFDAHLYSSSGGYPRRISQAAIQNITALGGAGAVAAIQRSFLHFFDEFSYSEIGWRCALQDNICRMGGIELDDQASELQGYTIIESGGIPAITVMGYNRDVSWYELINRLKRITEGSSPIIQ